MIVPRALCFYDELDMLVYGYMVDSVGINFSVVFRVVRH